MELGRELYITLQLIERLGYEWLSSFTSGMPELEEGFLWEHKRMR